MLAFSLCAFPRAAQWHRFEAALNIKSMGPFIELPLKPAAKVPPYSEVMIGKSEHDWTENEKIYPADN